LIYENLPKSGSKGRRGFILFMEGGCLMRNSPYCVIAVKTIILSIFGLSTLPFWAVVVQFIDSVTGFSSGQGYHSASQRYIFESPLIYILVVLCINVVAGIAFLAYAHYKEKKGGSI